MEYFLDNFYFNYIISSDKYFCFPFLVYLRKEFLRGFTILEDSAEVCLKWSLSWMGILSLTFLMVQLYSALSTYILLQLLYV